MLLTFATIEDADSPIPAIMNFVASQYWVAVRLDPDPSHGIVKDLIALNDAQPTIVNQNSTILSTPDLVFRNGGVTAGPANQKQCRSVIPECMHLASSDKQQTNSVLLRECIYPASSAKQQTH